jgi:hypothetical protein
MFLNLNLETSLYYIMMITFLLDDGFDGGIVFRVELGTML